MSDEASDHGMRRGDWFLTFTGKKFWPLDPLATEICIEDIAHHLSLICRYNGGCRVFYSVAQHSIMVSDILPPHLKFAGLMHDATEAYLGDMIKPLKCMLPDYRAAEDHLSLVIAYKYGINYNVEDYRQIKVADNVALMTERRDLLIPSPHLWSTKELPLPQRIRPMEPKEAELKFLNLFDQLKPK